MQTGMETDVELNISQVSLSIVVMSRRMNLPLLPNRGR